MVILCLSDRPEMWVMAALNNLSVFILVLRKEAWRVSTEGCDGTT